jgi:hypothetical protein
MDGRGNYGESVAIIGMACRFPGARDPAEFHDLAVAGRGMFQPAAALPGRPLRGHAGQPAGGGHRTADAVRGGIRRPRRGSQLRRGRETRSVR